MIEERQAVEAGEAFREAGPPANGRVRRKRAVAPLSFAWASLAAAVVAGTILAIPATRAAILGPAAALAGTVKDRIASDPPMEGPDPVRGVRVFAVGEARTHLERSFTGTVVARYETAIGFRVAGKILSRTVEVGQSVRTGDLLFALDPADSRAAVSAAEATLAAARAQAVQTAADERRQARLLADGWTTQAAYDRIKAAADAAANQARAAADQLVLARNALSYAELRAPHDGIVTAVRAEAGQVVPAGQPVLSLVRPGDREALVMVPEGQIADIRGWSATARFWSRPNAAEPATLREIAPQADPASRTYAVRYSLPASADSADLGSTVTVRLSRAVAGSAAETPTEVPTTAVIFRDGTPIVWRLDASGERVQPVPVSVVRLGAVTADVRGLAVGDRIVTLGVHRLDEGVRVRVVEGPRPQAAAANATAIPDSRGEGGRS